MSLMIGGLVPESDKAWDMIMDLKDIVELVVSQKVTEEAVWYLESKISCHRKLFKEVFPDANLRPKQHFLEHYPYLIRCFGPLVDLWTMRFEAKHSFFKKVVHETQNFRNLLKTLSNKHQLMMACAMDSQNLFKAPLHVENVKVLNISSLNARLRVAVERKYANQTSFSFTNSVP